MRDVKMVSRDLLKCSRDAVKIKTPKLLSAHLLHTKR